MKYKLTFQDKHDQDNLTERIVNPEEVTGVVNRADLDDFLLVSTEPVDSELDMSSEKSLDITPKNPYKGEGLKSFARGITQGATLGLADEIPFGEDKEEARARNKLAEKENPVAYGVGEWMGGIPGDILLGKGLQKGGAKVAAKLAEKGQGIASTIARLTGSPSASGLTAGTLTSAAAGAGTAEGDRVEGAAKGGIAGLLGGLIGDSLGKKISKIPESKFPGKIDELLEDVGQVKGIEKELSKQSSKIPEIDRLQSEALDSLSQLDTVKSLVKDISPEDKILSSQLADLEREAIDIVNSQGNPARDYVENEAILKKVKEQIAKLQKDLVEKKAKQLATSKALGETRVEMSIPTATSGRAGEIISRKITMPQGEPLASPLEMIKQMDKEEEKKLVEELIRLQMKKGGKQ